MPNQRRQQEPKDDKHKPDSLWAQQRDLTKWKARQVELEVLEAEGKLVAIEHVMTIWEQAASAIRAKLLSLPTKLAPVVIGARTIPEAQTLLKQAIHEALSELSRLQLGTVQPSAGPDGERVGGPVPATQS